jgi:capsular polysaccharide transport system ATP-binding protein
LIRFTSVSKRYIGAPSKRAVLENVCFSLSDQDRLGVVGNNGSGKSTLIRLAAGVEKPTTGRVERTMTCSWPLGFGGAFQTSLSGYDNVRFIARVYDVDIENTLEFVRDFSELGVYLSAPVRTYSSGMRAKFAFALSLAVDFDCMLVDEIISVGDEAFRKKCRSALTERSSKSLIFASHERHHLEEYCNRFAVIKSGVFTPCDTLDDAFRLRDAPHEN